MMRIHLDIQRINAAALPHADILLRERLPDGVRKGKEFWATNPVRGDRTPGSFSIDMHTGKWHDFASGDKGGDLVSLFAYLSGCTQLEAARMIARRLGLPFGDSTKRDLLAEEVERQRLARQRDQRQQQADAKRQAEWQRSARQASRQWRQADLAAPHHPYLTHKRIKPHHLRQHGDLLLAPICWRGELVNLQRIAADGSKRFLQGGRVTGGYCPFGRIEAGIELYIVEGIATAATLHEQTGKPVAAAMSAGNLLAVGLELKHRYPDAVLIVAGDDDRAKEAEGKPNAGKLAAIRAAAALGCSYVLPDWPEDAPLHLSDMNDLAVWMEGRE